MTLVVKVLENSTYCVFCFINENCNKHIFPLFLFNPSIAYLPFSFPYSIMIRYDDVIIISKLILIFKCRMTWKIVAAK